LRVTTTWGDPTTAYQLARALVNDYLDYVVGTVASDSNAAVDFYKSVQRTATTDVDKAQQALDDYVSGLPPVATGKQQPIDEQLKMQRLNRALELAQTALSDAQAHIQTAQLSVQQAKSEAGKVLRVVDKPAVATAAESKSKQRVLKLAIFIILGVLIAAGALIVAAMLDGAVRSVEDIYRAGAGTVIATIPVVADRRRRSSSSGKQTREAPPQGSRKRAARTAAAS
jgi:uncharacterized protein involved in exopolysaccharide biosynthesis